VIRGLIQAESGEFADCQRSLKSALKLDPQNANAKQMMEVVVSLAQAQPSTAVVPTK